MRKTIELCGRSVQYELLRKKVKNLNLRIKADGTVSVSAPSRVPLADIEFFLHSKESFIVKALERFEGSAVTAEYRDGDLLPLFGESLPLRLSEQNKNTAGVEGKTIALRVKDKNDTELKRKTLEAFYRRECEAAMDEICRSLYSKFEPYGVPYPELRYRKMKSRWGSCMPQKKIVTFNTLLALSPKKCMEFVAAHEFCHFLHPDHSARFYSCLTAVMPDWKERKLALREYSVWLK